MTETSAPVGFFHPSRPSSGSQTCYSFVPHVRKLFRLRHHRRHRPVPRRGPPCRAEDRRRLQYDVQHRRHPRPPFAGMLIDRLGTRKASIIFSVLVFAGAAVVWQARSIPLMFLGRLHLRRRRRAPRRRPERHAGPLVQEEGAGALLRRGPDHEPARLAFRFQQRRAHHEIFRELPQRASRRRRRVRLSFIGNLCYIVMDKRGEKILNLRDESAGDKIVFKDIKEFKPTFWYVTFCA